jgi:hypothetical protein
MVCLNELLCKVIRETFRANVYFPVERTDSDNIQIPSFVCGSSRATQVILVALRS